MAAALEGRAQPASVPFEMGRVVVGSAVAAGGQRAVVAVELLVWGWRGL